LLEDIMKRLRALLVAILAGSLLVALRKRRCPPGAVVDDPARNIHRRRPSTAGPN
jgi:hypothetical protein